MDIELSFLEFKQMDQAWDQILRVYREAFSGPPYDRTEIHVLDFSGILTTHRQREGFRFAAAREQKKKTVVGIAYGYTSRKGYWWHDVVARQCSPEVMETWIDEAFELVEFAVLPAYHGKGIGGKLHDFALDGLPHRRAVLSTVQSETNALQLYRKRGWRILLDNFYFPSVAKPYLIMGLDLLEFKKRRESPPSST